MMHAPNLTILLTVLFAAVLSQGAGCGSAQPPAGESASKDLIPGLREALLFHAGFDEGWDAGYAKADRRLYNAPSYEEQDKATPGIGSPDVEIAYDVGRYQHALKFNKKNTRAIFYRAEDNVAFTGSGWSGTVSFWLSLDPAADLEPGFCDPIQITDAAYNDACIWVDFTKENPRKFRMGVFGDLSVWNPKNIPPDQNPDFEKRLVVVEQPPFAKGKWTHIVITHEGLGSAQGGAAKLYIDGKLQGEAKGISEPFTWDKSKAAIRLGVNYVGLYDDIAIFSRPLTEEEIQLIHGLEKGITGVRF